MKAPLIVPAFTAYVEPNPEGAEVREATGITSWKDARQSLNWFGHFGPGDQALTAAVRLRLPAGEKVRLQLTVTQLNSDSPRASQTYVSTTTGQAGQSVVLDYDRIIAPFPGYYRFRLEGLEKSGATYGDIESLVLDGPAVAGAHFNLKERRNAASVHLGYPIPPTTKVVGFYNEVTVKTDPIWSYYMACGFRRGYFGIQVNSPTERRVIFSIWDSGNEAVDRNKVGADDRVRLLAKGDGVYTGDFGNEGTGGHSHLKYTWKTGTTHRFFVTAQADGDVTVYAGYFWFPERRNWGLIARFRAPKDGNTLSGLYSFNENFGGANGELRRLAEFGNQWVLTADGKWQELTQARFTHDATGKEDRKDYAAGTTRGRFFLSNGGFLESTTRLGDTFTRPTTKKPPRDLPADILPKRVG